MISIDEIPDAEMKDDSKIEAEIEALTRDIGDVNKARISSTKSEAGVATHFVSWVSLLHITTFIELIHKQVWSYDVPMFIDTIRIWLEKRKNDSKIMHHTVASLYEKVFLWVCFFW